MKANKRGGRIFGWGSQVWSLKLDCTKSGLERKSLGGQKRDNIDPGNACFLTCWLLKGVLGYFATTWQGKKQPVGGYLTKVED